MSMTINYVLDSCALLAHVYDEAGADNVESLLEQASRSSAHIYMNKLNLYEAYYDVVRSHGVQQAEAVYSMVLKSPIQIIDGISDAVLRQGAQFKTKYKMSLADSIMLGQASTIDASVITSDHHELDVVEKSEDISFTWIR